MISHGEHVFISGVSGSGKSTLTRKVADFFDRIVVFDRLNEWNDDNYFYVYDFNSFSKTYKELHAEDHFIIVVKYKHGISQEFLFQETEKILNLIYQIESQLKLGLALIFEEAWLYCTPYYIGPYLSEMLLTGRHARISVISNTQRPASVHKNIISQCRHVFVGQYFEARDALYFKQTLGDQPSLDKPLQKYQFLWYRVGFDSVIITT